MEGAAVVEEFARLAPQYETRWSFYIGATIWETLARLELRGTERVLDLGCGTGALFRRVSEVYPNVRLVGLDPVPEMLTLARGRLPRQVSLCEGWAERLPFASGCFDVVVSASMFHYVSEPDLALAEMHRVLRHGGAWC